MSEGAGGEGCSRVEEGEVTFPLLIAPQTVKCLQVEIYMEVNLKFINKR